MSHSFVVLEVISQHLVLGKLEEFECQLSGLWQVASDIRQEGDGWHTDGQTVLARCIQYTGDREYHVTSLLVMSLSP